MKFISLTLLSLASTVYSQEQHFTVGLKVTVVGASGDPNDAKCTHLLEKKMVEAYAATYPNQDTHLDSVHFDKVSPTMFEYNGVKVGTAGNWGYMGSGTFQSFVSCRLQVFVILTLVPFHSYSLHHR